MSAQLDLPGVVEYDPCFHPSPFTPVIIVTFQEPLPCHRCEAPCTAGFNCMPFYEDYTWEPKEPGTSVALCDACFELFDRRGNRRRGTWEFSRIFT